MSRAYPYDANDRQTSWGSGKGISIWLEAIPLLQAYLR